jgi:hypothetical protein
MQVVANIKLYKEPNNGDEIGGARSTNGEKCIQNIGRKIWKSRGSSVSVVTKIQVRRVILRKQVVRVGSGWNWFRITFNDWLWIIFVEFSNSTGGDLVTFFFTEVEMGELKLNLSLYWTKYHAMKTYWGNVGVAPRILNLDTRWSWVVSFTSRSPYSGGKSPWYPLDRRLGRLQSRSGCGEEKNPCPCRNLTSSPQPSHYIDWATPDLFQ